MLAIIKTYLAIVQGKQHHDVQHFLAFTNYILLAKFTNYSLSQLYTHVIHVLNAQGSSEYSILKNRIRTKTTTSSLRI